MESQFSMRGRFVVNRMEVEDEELGLEDDHQSDVDVEVQRAKPKKKSQYRLEALDVSFASGSSLFIAGAATYAYGRFRPSLSIINLMLVYLSFDCSQSVMVLCVAPPTNWGSRLESILTYMRMLLIQRKAASALEFIPI